MPQCGEQHKGREAIFLCGHETIARHQQELTFNGPSNSVFLRAAAKPLRTHPGSGKTLWRALAEIFPLNDRGVSRRTAARCAVVQAGRSKARIGNNLTARFPIQAPCSEGQRFSFAQFVRHRAIVLARSAKLRHSLGAAADDRTVGRITLGPFSPAPLPLPRCSPA